MAFDYIKKEELYQKYSDAKKFMLPLFDPFDEYERISRNKPHPGIAKNLPKVTDGTLAALIQEQPKRVIQQIPTGKVISNSKWLSIVGTYIFEKEIIPNSNQQAALIQKCWALISKCLTYGSQPTFVQFVHRGEYFGTDFNLPYIKDVLLEPGKLSDRDSNVIFLRTWWTPNQVEAIIAKENMLIKSSKNRLKDDPTEEQYESGWNIPLLKKLVKLPGQKDVQSQTPNEKKDQLNEGFIEIVHAFQRGIGATFYSFSPQLPDKDNIIREKVNKDPRGMIPIHYIYANVDLSNPLGRGSVEISGGMQNLLDSEVQSYQYMRALLMNPPVELRGDVSKSVIKYEPQAVWDMGTDPNASVKPVDLTTDSLTSFPNNYGLIKSQILNLNSSTDTSVSSESGNPGFSKTPAGVNMTEQRLGISDNYIRRQFESTWEEIAETEINLYFAERSGIQTLQLDEDTANKLKQIEPESVNENNEIQVDYDTETEQLKFEVDATTSSAKDNVAERDRLVELLDMTQKYPALAQMIGEEGIKELVNRIVIKTGVEDPEKIMPTQKDEVDENGNPIEQQPEQPQGMQPEEVMQMIQQAIEESKKGDPAENPMIKLMDALKIKFSDLPEDSQHKVLDEIGLDSQENTPTARKLNIEAARVGVQADDQYLKSEAQEANLVQSQQDSESPQEPQEEFNATDDMIIEELQKRGYNEDQISKALVLIKNGSSNQEILQALENGGSDE